MFNLFSRKELKLGNQLLRLSPPVRLYKANNDIAALTLALARLLPTPGAAPRNIFSRLGRRAALPSRIITIQKRSSDAISSTDAAAVPGPKNMSAYAAFIKRAENTY
jgi:hypothetical protein